MHQLINQQLHLGWQEPVSQASQRTNSKHVVKQHQPIQVELLILHLKTLGSSLVWVIHIFLSLFSKPHLFQSDNSSCLKPKC